MAPFEQFANSFLAQVITFYRHTRELERVSTYLDIGILSQKFLLQQKDNKVDHLLFLRSDDIIRLLEQNGRLLHKSVILF